MSTTHCLMTRRPAALPTDYPWLVRFAFCLALLLLFTPVAHLCGTEPRVEFLAAHCADCHQGAGAEAGFDIDRLDQDLANPETLAQWIEVYDRVADGEMPPPDEVEPPPAEESKRFTEITRQWLYTYERAEIDQRGRVEARRLTNLQLERSLQDLLGIDIPLEREMPQAPKSGSFDTLARSQSISHFQLEQHLKVVDLALDEAFRRALTQDDHKLREMTAKQISRTRTRTREPELIDGAAVVWSSNLIFYGRLPATTAREDGWYRFRFRVSALKKPEQHGVWCTVRTGQCVSSAPLMSWVGSFEATDEPQEFSFDAWLPAGHMLEIRPGDRTLKMARFQGGQSANGEGGRQNVPGIQIDWLSQERIHLGPDDDAIRSLLFGDLKVVLATKQQEVAVESAHPKVDGGKLLKSFASRAYRRPVTTEQLVAVQQLFEAALAKGQPFHAALRAGYRAILCSPRFLYFIENPGPLDDYAIASRLSYFLWSSTPDAELLTAAANHRLAGHPEEIRRQLARMLAAPRGQTFLRDFANQWLELSEIDFTEPDRKTHPDFDQIVQYAMLDETQTFLQHVLDNNRNVAELVDCSYTFLNSRLARFYNVEGVDGHRTQQVELAEDAQRGGLLTHGSILKITANGTHTSPVLRGVWVSRRILGQPIPQPPDNVPAIEPDIRGAKTIREQLEKHRASPQCASCHVKIDPPGYALENFDAAGRWRELYRTDRKSKSLPVDASYITAEGEPFEDIVEFRRLAAASPEPIARNLAAQLLAYGTGAEVGFADRPEIVQIVEHAAQKDYGLRTIVEEVVTSLVFLSK